MKEMIEEVEETEDYDEKDFEEVAGEPEAECSTKPIRLSPEIPRQADKRYCRSESQRRFRPRR